jgi:peptidyl-dipeptidase Dcp
MESALLDKSTLPFAAVPFSQIQIADFIPAIEEGIEIAKKRIQKVIEDTNKPNFENTIVALESSSEELDRASAIFFNLLSCEAGPELHALAAEISAKLSAYSNDISLNEKLFKKVKECFETTDKNALTAERKILLEKTYKSFARNGALLNEEKKEQLRALDTEASGLWPKFSENVLKATNKYELWVDNDEALKEIPSNVLEEAKAKAVKKGKADSYFFGLDAPTYTAFMTYCSDTHLREKMWRAYAQRAVGGEFDNRSILKRIVELRQKRAQLLGYEHHAAYVLEERMARKPEKVVTFLRDLLKVSKPAAQKELSELKDFKKQLSSDGEFSPWDFAYYSEKLKQEKYDFNEEELRPYFSIANVMEGAFEHARKLYSLEFKKRSDIPVYHSEVDVYEVLEKNTGEHIGILYMDPYPRETKKNGAWMTVYRDQSRKQSKRSSPLVSIVCNFTKPTATKPSLLTLNEVLTLFHEFGHALHALLSDCEFASLAGPNVFWDFVELPSQIMENWVYQKESLNIFAKHYQSGEKLPESYLEKLKKSMNFQAGYGFTRQIQFALLDMAWHSLTGENQLDVESFENDVVSETRLFPPQPGANISCSFSHIFSGGYSAGYYSYKWSEVLEADAFEYFVEKGIFNLEVA